MNVQDRNGERQKRHGVAQDRRVGKQAEIAQQYLKKGSLVFIEGRIQSREWQDKEVRNAPALRSSRTTFACLGGAVTAPAPEAAGERVSSRSGDEFDQAGLSEEPIGGGHGGPEISDEDIPF